MSKDAQARQPTTNSVDPASSGAPLQNALPWFNYRQGVEDAVGARIIDLITKSAHGCVYMSESEALGWIYDPNLARDANVSISEAAALIDQVNATVGRRSTRLRAKRAIGVALGKAFDDRVENDSRDFFSDARAYIHAIREETLHLHYLLAAFVAAVVIALFVGFGAAVADVPPLFLTAARMGAVGAFVSVAQRFRTISIDRYSSRLYTAFAGVSRILLGAIFGALFLLLHKAGLLLAIANDQSYLLACASFIAGFSERLIPEILKRFENEIEINPHSGTA